MRCPPRRAATSPCYPISPGGTTGNPSLKALAEFTGGFTPNVSLRSMTGFERMVREQSTHYLLGFNAAEERRDGRYVRTEVRVKRPGLQVRSLDGYLAPRKRIEPEKRPPGLLAAVWDAVASPLTTSGVPMRVYAAPFKGTGQGGHRGRRDRDRRHETESPRGGRRVSRRARDGVRHHRHQEPAVAHLPAPRHRGAQARHLRACQPQRAARALAAARCPKGGISCASRPGARRLPEASSTTWSSLTSATTSR